MARPSRSMSVASRKSNRHIPLSEDIAATGSLRQKAKKRKSTVEDDNDRYVDSRSSRKILKIGQDLADEVNEVFTVQTPNPAFAFNSRFGNKDDPAEVGKDDEEEEAWGDEDEDTFEEPVGPLVRTASPPPLTRSRKEIDPHDVSLFNKFMPSSTSQDHVLESTMGRSEKGEGRSRNLAEIILEKIAAHEAIQGGQPMIQGGGPPEEAVELPAKVVEVYSKYANCSCIQAYCEELLMSSL